MVNFSPSQPFFFFPMTAPILIWLQFLFCATLIGMAGYQLSRYGDVISRRTGSVSYTHLTLPTNREV